MRETDLAWIAGFFDGEGSLIGFFRNQQRKLGRIACCIVNSDRGVLEWIKNALAFEVDFYLYKKQKAGLGKKKVWILRTSGVDNLIRFLELVKPHLRVKRIQADFALVFLRSRKQRRRKPHNEFELNLIEKMRELNRNA